MRRKLKDADVYLFFNEGPDNLTHAVTLRSEGHRLERWDPQTGEVTPIPATTVKGAVKVQLTLKPYETNIIVVR